MKMRQLSDAEIIESVKKGNSADYSILVDRYKNKALALLKRMLKNEFDAEEVLMDCFLKVYHNLSSFKFESKFSTWFYRIVYNTALTKLSVKKYRTENEMQSIDELYYLESKYAADEFNRTDIASMVKKIVNELPVKNAAVVTMFYLEDMSCEEIADVLQISEANVKVILFRSRNMLKEIIEKKNLLSELL